MGSAVTTTEVREAKLNLDVLQAQLPPKQRHMITADTVAELDKFSKDPDYGQEFLDVYRDHLNILGTNPKYTSRSYMSAVKFFTLMEGGMNITDSYITVFPERLARRIERGQKKEDMSGEASRYNGTALVNEIRKVAGFPVQLIHRHLLHEAILETATLMTTAKSEMVRQKAADTLIRELKPAEDNIISIDVKDGAKSAIAALHDATEKLVIKERQSIEAGTPIKEIIEGKIVQDEVIEDIEPEPIPEPKSEPKPKAKAKKVKDIKPGDWKF